MSDLQRLRFGVEERQFSLSFFLTMPCSPGILAQWQWLHSHDWVVDASRFVSSELRRGDEHFRPSSHRDLSGSAQRGELTKIIKWLRKEGSIDALCSESSTCTALSLLLVAASNDHLEVVRVWVVRGLGRAFLYLSISIYGICC